MHSPTRPALGWILSLGLAIGHLATVQAAPQPAKSARKAAASQPAADICYASRPDAMQLAAEMAEHHGMPREWVESMLGQARYLAQVPRLVTPPARGFVKNWTVYRSRFVEPIRIRAGVDFWQANREALERAERQFDVPAEIIVGIIGVETIYGRQMGNFRVMDALATLSLDFPRAHPRALARTEYFRGELAQMLLTAYRSGIDPFSIRGSYAGAMGMGQFMPTSWDQWAVDFDGDGRIDMFHSAADAIGSVANYFVGHGWQSGLPSTFAVDMQARGQDLAELQAPDILPSFTAAQMAAKGARVLGGEDYRRPLALITLENGSSGPTQYLAGTENFYAITRYNWSAFYALSVIELGQRVHEAYLSRQQASAYRSP
ncbi:hypothetical protein GCM10010975_02700 [Comamonas phosphati]|nr:hypothetical protein GCM10010975_02700 [Comamonas phosphati]